jgi:hypothetical protein
MTHDDTEAWWEQEAHKEQETLEQERMVVPLRDEIPWHPAMQSLIEWRNKLNLAEDDPEKHDLERLLFQLDGRVRWLSEKRRA